MNEISHRPSLIRYTGILGMDVIVCGGLTALELVALNLPGRGLDGPQTLKSFLMVLLVQYALLKVYRIILYPNFLSPLRHLPGPKVLYKS